MREKGTSLRKFEKYVTRQAFILTDLISEILPTEERDDY